MHFRRLVRWLAVTVLMAHWALCQQNMVNMLVLVDGTVAGPKIVSFTENLFRQFYSCLCNDRAVTCSATLSSVNQVVKGIDQGTDVSSIVYSTFYKCTIPTTLFKMECNRVQQATAPCDKSTLSTSFTMTGHTTTCSSGCVGFVWKSHFENLDLSHSSLDFDTCQGHCYGVVTTVGSTINRKPRTISTPRTQASSATNMLASTISQRTSTLTSKASDDNIGLIIGVVFGILAIIIIAVIVLAVLWRRRRKSIESKAKTDTVLNNTSASSNNRITKESTAHYAKVSNNESKQCSVSVAAQITLPGDDLPGHGQYSAWTTGNNHIICDALSRLKHHAEETNIEDKNTTNDFAFEDIARYKDKRNEKTLLVPSKHLRVSVEFGYSNVIETESRKSLEQFNIMGQNVMADQEQGVMTSSEKELGKETVQVVSSIDNRRGETKINGDYDLATVTNGTEDTSQTSLPEGLLGGETGCRWSASDSCGYYEIDNESSKVEQLVKPVNFIHVEKETDEKLHSTDYEYIESVDQVEGAAFNELGTRVKKGETDYECPNIEDDDYSTINETRPESRDVYSKLGEKKREITNPYNVLLQPKQDPKTRKLLPEPGHSPEGNNKQSNHAVTHLHLHKPTSPIEIVDVKPHSDINIGSPSHQDNIPKIPQGNAIPDYAVVKKKSTSKEETNLYFELKKEEDTEESNNDAEAADYSVVKKKDKSTDKQEADYELEVETDASITNKQFPNYAVVKRIDK